MPGKTETGQIKFVERDRRFGFITTDRGDEIHFAAHAVEGPARWEELQPGTRVQFERKSGSRGPTAGRVRVIGGKAESKQTGYRFLNPYNFARYLPPGEENNGAQVRLLGRCAPPTHDRWVEISGTIYCRLRAITPIFVSDAELVKPDKPGGDHKEYNFFQWAGKKVIPAASLRGPIRAVFETITNSCFANMADKRLSYRLTGREIRTLVPARVEQQHEKWTLQLLTGSGVWLYGDTPKELFASGVRRYVPLEPKFKRHESPAAADINAVKHGEECWAVITRMRFPPSWRAVVLRKTKEDAEQEMAARLRNGRIKSDWEPRVVQGWYCETNQNADNKHSERFFFVDTESRSLPERIDLPLRVRRNYEDLILDYQERHERSIAQRQHPERVEKVIRDGKQVDEIAFSRFVLNPRERELRHGELVYAQLEGRATNPSVKFIAPVSWPRVAYEHTIGDLLPGDYLRRCKSLERLCPACRTFGWVHGDEEGAYRGRLRFSHATLKKEGEKVGPYRLAILSSPKPTTTRFYLVAEDGQPHNGRSDMAAGYDGKNRLRGRKFFRHFTPALKSVKEHSDQNRTIVDPEGPNAEFEFKVEFENLAEVELGSLLWALTLGKQGCHRLGYGKPLGLGSAQIEITAIETLDPAARYTSLIDSGYAETDQGERWIEAFQKAAEARWGVPFSQLAPVTDLLTLLNRQEPGLKVHYPYSSEQQPGQKQFEWFVGNKRDKGPKLELGLAVEDEGLPLIRKDGKVNW